MERLPAMTSKLRTLFATFLLLGAFVFAANPVYADITISLGDEDAEQGDVQDEDCANIDESLAGAYGCSTSDTVTDFTDWSGTMEAPDASGYDEALTENTNVRDFIQSVVNFALSFVGLICVVIVIYGGLLYVTSRGDEDQTSKAKKAISYAAIGIVIILGSYAFVNTLLQIGGGGTDSGNGTALDGETIYDSGAAFDVNDVLDEIEDISATYVEAYQTLLAVKEQTASMKALEMPVIVEVTENDWSLGGYIEFAGEWLSGSDDEHEDTYTVIDQASVDTYMTTLARAAQNVMTETDSLSDAYEAAYALYQYLQYGQTASFVSEDDAAFDACDEAYSVSDDSFSTGLGYSNLDADVQAIDPNICVYIAAIDTAAQNDYTETVGSPTEGSPNEGLIGRFDDLKELFVVDASVAGSNLTAINTALTEARATLLTARSTITNSTIQEIAKAMNELYLLVKNVQFVQVRLTASTTEGNAPLLVNFNILGTEDPSGKTVENDRIQWDLDGDGSYEFIGTDRLEADAVSTIFPTAGTYRVKVRVLSSDADIAAGVSTVAIEVAPAKSLIVLQATIGTDAPEFIADFTRDPVIDKGSFKVTASEAISDSGILFDASQTTDGDMNVDGIKYFEWDFGDNETLGGNADEAAVVRHFYAKEGTYNVSLTVTDGKGIKDTKYFKLYVASPAARIQTSPSSGIAGTTFTLDGSASSADGGGISSYQWAVTDEEGNAVTLEQKTGSSIDVVLSKPGVYNATLNIADASGTTDSTTTTILVESLAPVVTYKYEVENENQPAIVTFDARDSYDPDPEDFLTYEWDFGGFEGEDYEILEASDDLAQMTVQFLDTGSYTVVLTGKDQHMEAIQQSDTATATININSILDLDLTLNGDEARHLDENGEATVEFTAETQFGSAFQIDYGDGEIGFTDTIVGGKTIFTHTYKEAGIFYVTLTTYDDEEDENTNTDTTRVYIGNGNAPIAVIGIGSDGTDIGSGPEFYGSTETRFTFSATSSVNVDGSQNNLNYVWNFGDGTTATQATATKKFDERAPYTVTLTVRDKTDSSITDSATLTVVIRGLAPEIKGLSVAPQSTGELTTPLKVNVSVNASDEDSKISYYKAWYYDVDNSAEALWPIVSESPNFTLTINTDGETGDSKEYGFAVEVSDGSYTVSSFDELSEEEIPTLTVINGPNDTPTAAFTVDKSIVNIGDTVYFSSTSVDTDGEIVLYWWDTDGDGSFYNNEPVETGSYSYSFKQVHPEGVQVRLKVEDSAGATAESLPVTIYVDSLAEDPDAKFLANVNGTTVTFTNNSFVDTDQGAELAGVYWDFDLETDSDGNGVVDDDYDSFEESPTHSYPEFGTYKVNMTIVDTVGQTDSVTQSIEVKETIAPVAAFTFTVDDKTVTFKNASTFDTEHGVDVRSYTWDFDVNTDSSGDTEPENDADSTVKNPSFEFADYGLYDVKLTVEDSFGKVDSVTQTVDVESPIEMLSAILTSVPQANSLMQVILSTDGQEVTFYFGAEGGSEKYKYVLDKNIFYDTDLDGVRDNDKDYESTQAGSWKTAFYKAYGQTVTKLTVTDTETGDTDIATLQVAFEGSLGSANLFNATPKEMALLILSALLTVVLGVSMAFRYKPLPRS